MPWTRAGPIPYTRIRSPVWSCRSADSPWKLPTSSQAQLRRAVPVSHHPGAQYLVSSLRRAQRPRHFSPKVSMLPGEFTPGMALGTATSASQVMTPTKQHTFLGIFYVPHPRPLFHPQMILDELLISMQISLAGGD